MQLTAKDIRARRSSKLLRATTERKFSESTVEKIGAVLRPTRDDPIQHDRMVIKILDIVENSDTETEVLERLKALI